MYPNKLTLGVLCAIGMSGCIDVASLPYFADIGECNDPMLVVSWIGDAVSDEYCPAVVMVVSRLETLVVYLLPHVASSRAGEH